MGPSGGLSSSDLVTASAVKNTGAIKLNGGAGAQAALNVTGGVAGLGSVGVLSGVVDLSGDALLEFASGQITTLARQRVVARGTERFRR